MTTPCAHEGGCECTPEREQRRVGHDVLTGDERGPEKEQRWPKHASTRADELRPHAMKCADAECDEDGDEQLGRNQRRPKEHPHEREQIEEEVWLVEMVDGLSVLTPLHNPLHRMERMRGNPACDLQMRGIVNVRRFADIDQRAHQPHASQCEARPRGLVGVGGHRARCSRSASRRNTRNAGGTGAQVSWPAQSPAWCERASQPGVSATRSASRRGAHALAHLARTNVLAALSSSARTHRPPLNRLRRARATKVRAHSGRASSKDGFEICSAASAWHAFCKGSDRGFYAE